MSETKYFVAFAGGDCGLLFGNRDYIVPEVEAHVFQYITDHLKHDLPLKVDQEVLDRLDVQVYALDPAHNIMKTLPVQQWFDEYYKIRKNAAQDEEKRERRRLRQLLDKYGLPEGYGKAA